MSVIVVKRLETFGFLLQGGRVVYYCHLWLLLYGRWRRGVEKGKLITLGRLLFFDDFDDNVAQVFGFVQLFEVLLEEQEVVVGPGEAGG